MARRRGELMAEAAVQPGSMTAVSQPVERIRELLAQWDLPVVIANQNAPKQVVLSGETTAIEAAEAKLAEVGRGGPPAAGRNGLPLACCSGSERSFR